MFVLKFGLFLANYLYMEKTHKIIEVREGFVPGIPTLTIIDETIYDININVNDIIYHSDQYYQVQFRVIKTAESVNDDIIELYCFKLNKPYPFLHEN